MTLGQLHCKFQAAVIICDEDMKEKYRRLYNEKLREQILIEQAKGLPYKGVQHET